MGLKQEWQQLSGHTKMFIIGGGAVALFFLYTAFKNSQSNDQSTTTNTSSGPATQAIDPNAEIDAMTQQMQQLTGGISDSLNQTQQQIAVNDAQNMEAIQQLVEQNQQATQQQIQSLISTMSTNPNYPSVPAPTQTPTSTPATSTPANLFTSGVLTGQQTRFVTEMQQVSNPNNNQLQTMGSIAAKDINNVAFNKSVLSTKQQRFITDATNIVKSGGTLDANQQQTLGSLVVKAGTIKK